MVFFRRSASLPRAWYDRWWWSCGRGKKTWVKLCCIVGADSADSADSADCACAVAGPWKISSHTKAWRRDLREGSSPGEPPTPARPSRPTPSALLHLVASCCVISPTFVFHLHVLKGVQSSLPSDSTGRRCPKAAHNRTIPLWTMRWKSDW